MNKSRAVHRSSFIVHRSSFILPPTCQYGIKIDSATNQIKDRTHDKRGNLTQLPEGNTLDYDELGDMLFLPAGCGHQVTTPTAAISIDFPWEKNANLGLASMRLKPSKWLSKLRGKLGYGK